MNISTIKKYSANNIQEFMSCEYNYNPLPIYYEQSTYSEREYEIKESEIFYEMNYKREQKEIAENSLSTKSYHSTPSLTPAVSIEDLEECSKYELQWHVGRDCVPKCVVAKFDRKIMNCDPRYVVNEIEECIEFDLVFEQENTGNMFTIHSDLVETGIVDFYLLPN
jgi:hypothetical protein